MSNPSFMESLNFLDLYCIIKETDSRKESKESFYKKQAESNRGYTLVAVSYTHLDVYKRQRLRSHI